MEMFIGMGLAAVIAAAGAFGWQQALEFAEKLERHGVSVKAWREDDPSREGVRLRVVNE